ncbi:MAG: GAF domain-containing sensor histidine kinase [Armatimonadetes bacterium]|nr:GAF domain-containing sensor histidine kinase [Anaerolineae bacterium]
MYTSDIRPEIALIHHQATIETLHKILRVLNSNRSLDEILAHIIAQPRQLLQCDAAAIYCLDQDQNLYIQASKELDHSLTQFNQAMSRNLAEQTLSSREPTVVADCNSLLSDTRTQEDPDRLAYIQNLARHYGAFIAVPLIVKGEIYGALMVYYHHPRFFAADEVNLVVAFGDQAALALENTWLHDQVRQSAIATERDRIARDLHDSVTQALYGITLCTEAAIRQLAQGDTAAATERLHQMQQLTQEGLREMRALIFELHSPLMHQAGLVEALHRYSQFIEAHTMLHMTVQVAGAIKISAKAAQTLYRIVQEAVNNVIKHSQATTVTLLLTQTDQCITLSITDQGIGFDTKRNTQGFGLKNMAERAAALGGRFMLESTPGTGTALCVEVPV